MIDVDKRKMAQIEKLTLGNVVRHAREQDQFHPKAMQTADRICSEIREIPAATGMHSLVLALALMLYEQTVITETGGNE